VGDEGGFAPPLAKFEEALDLLTDAIKVCLRCLVFRSSTFLFQAICTTFFGLF